MTENSDISDETLTAYLDDELSAEDHAAIEGALETDAGLKARLSALEVPVDALRQGADAALEHAPTLPELPNTKSTIVRPRMAGLVAACAVGVLFGLWWQASDEQGWVEAVANYQSLYVTETLTRSESAEQRVATLRALSATIGHDLSPLMGISSLEYRRAQLLGFEGQPLVQVAYLDGDAPIAICITLREGEDQPLEQGEYFGMAAASWQKDGRGYLVIGGKDTSLIKRVANEVRESL